MSKLLINESPILVPPTLAKKIGLNEALFIQQLHYWLVNSTHIYDGYQWVYNTYEEWQMQFPFWSTSTIRRIIRKLEQKGLIVTGNYNYFKVDKTKWYRINYDYLESLMDEDGQLNEQNSEQHPATDRKTEQRTETYMDQTYYQNINKSDIQKEKHLHNGTDQHSTILAREPMQNDANLTNQHDQKRTKRNKETGQIEERLSKQSDQTRTKMNIHTAQHDTKLSTSIRQTEQHNTPNLTPAQTNLTKAIPETTSKITPKNTTEKKCVVVNAHAHVETQNLFTFFEHDGFG